MGVNHSHVSEPIMVDDTAIDAETMQRLITEQKARKQSQHQHRSAGKGSPIKSDALVDAEIRHLERRILNDLRQRKAQRQQKDGSGRQRRRKGNACMLKSGSCAEHVHEHHESKHSRPHFAGRCDAHLRPLKVAPLVTKGSTNNINSSCTRDTRAMLEQLMASNQFNDSILSLVEDESDYVIDRRQQHKTSPTTQKTTTTQADMDRQRLLLQLLVSATQQANKSGDVHHSTRSRRQHSRKNDCGDDDDDDDRHQLPPCEWITTSDESLESGAFRCDDNATYVSELTTPS